MKRVTKKETKKLIIEIVEAGERLSTDQIHKLVNLVHSREEVARAEGRFEALEDFHKTLMDELEEFRDKEAEFAEDEDKKEFFLKVFNAHMSVVNKKISKLRTFDVVEGLNNYAKKKKSDRVDYEPDEPGQDQGAREKS